MSTEAQALKKNRRQKELLEWLESVIGSICFLLLIMTFFVRVANVDGISMYPTLFDKDRIIISSLFYTPTQGDIVVVTQPNKDNVPLIKRIIATEGQTVDIDFNLGTVTVDGQALTEDYINEPTFTEYDVPFPVTVPKGYVFVLGDNRNHSKDSRDADIGMVDNRYLLGRLVVRILPFSRAGTVT